eukprot:gene27982-biopygen24015
MRDTPRTMALSDWEVELQYLEVVVQAAVVVTMSFAYITTAPQTFVVPPLVYHLYIRMAGAEGGLCDTNANSPGLGAVVSSTLQVVPGSTLSIFIGGRGGATTGGITYFGGGYNGGGQGFGGAGGGGATDIRNGSAQPNNRLMVAGGGGGPYSHLCASSTGGNGGNPNGLDGTVSGCGSATVGGGATQLTWGVNSGQSSFNGELMYGGGEATGSLSCAGGGGGYYALIKTK